MRRASERERARAEGEVSEGASERARERATDQERARVERGARKGASERESERASERRPPSAEVLKSGRRPRTPAARVRGAAPITEFRVDSRQLFWLTPYNGFQRKQTQSNVQQNVQPSKELYWQTSAQTHNHASTRAYKRTSTHAHKDFNSYLCYYCLV